MLASMTRRQWVEWQAFFELRPFGEWAADARSAQVDRTIRNLVSKHPVSIEDCMLKFGGEKNERHARAQSVSEQKHIALVLAALNTDKKNKKRLGASKVARSKKRTR